MHAAHSLSPPPSLKGLSEISRRCTVKRPVRLPSVAYVFGSTVLHSAVHPRATLWELQWHRGDKLLTAAGPGPDGQAQELF